MSAASRWAEADPVAVTRSHTFFLSSKKKQADGGAPTRSPCSPRDQANTSSRGDPLRPVRVGKRGTAKDLRLRPALVAALLPGLGHGDHVTLVSAGGRAPDTPATYSVGLPHFRRVGPDGGVSTDYSFSAGWARFREAHALMPDDTILFEALGGGGREGGGDAEGAAAAGSHHPSPPTPLLLGDSKLALRAAVVRGEPRVPAELRPWPRSGTVSVQPSAVAGSSMILFVPNDAFQSLFPDCGEAMLVDVAVVGEGGRGPPGRTWRVKVVRGGGNKTRCTHDFKHGRISAGWPALAREAFGGALQAGQTLELTRQGDRFGGPGPREVVMRVLDD